MSHSGVTVRMSQKWSGRENSVHKCEKDESGMKELHECERK